MPSASTTDPGATSLGWRLANVLAIASPYAVAGALFLVLYLSRAPAPPSFETSEATAPAASASGASVPVEADTTGTAAAAATPSQPAPQPLPVSHAKQAKPPAPVHPPAMEPQTSSHDAVRGQPVRVDPAVAATMKLSGAPPSYPAIARAAGVEGTVVVALTIGPKGSVLDAHAVSGPPLLQPGTVFAVRSWRYRPWLAYGNAIPFETEVSIHFEINSPSSGR
ncbi:MAG TPA: energy transducer TonB [Acidobacteriaceae bacterium]|nr:energy transducer TonB [Acidobacteriaceae bacterium]